MPAGVRVDGEHGMVQITSETPNFRFLGRFRASEYHESTSWSSARFGLNDLRPVYEARVHIQTDTPPLVFFPADTPVAWLSGIVQSGNGYWVSWTTEQIPGEILAFSPFSGPASGGLFEVYKGDGTLAFSTSSRFLKIKAVSPANTQTYVGTGPMAVAMSCYPAHMRAGANPWGHYSWYRTLSGVALNQGYAGGQPILLISKGGAPVVSANSQIDPNGTIITIDTTGM